jgi:hypothetical protein
MLILRRHVWRHPFACARDFPPKIVPGRFSAAKNSSEGGVSEHPLSFCLATGNVELLHKPDPRHTQAMHVFDRLTQFCAKLQLTSCPCGQTPFVLVRVKPKYVIRTSESSIEKIALAVQKKATVWQTAQPDAK